MTIKTIIYLLIIYFQIILINSYVIPEIQKPTYDDIYINENEED